MKHTKSHPHQLTLTVRTENGAASIDVDIGWLTTQERKFLHRLVKHTHEGGSVGFGVEPGACGASILKLTLGEHIVIQEAAKQEQRPEPMPVAPEDELKLLTDRINGASS